MDRGLILTSLGGLFTIVGMWEDLQKVHFFKKTVDHVSISKLSEDFIKLSGVVVGQ
jgi:hypothetical protein